MPKRGFNEIAHQIREQLTEIAEKARLSIDTVVNVLAGKFGNAVAHGEPCMQAIQRAAGDNDKVTTLSRHIRGYDL
jgi:hypothetical protein